MELIVTQLIHKLPACYGNLRFITAFARAHQFGGPSITFLNKLEFYGKELLAPDPTPKLGDIGNDIH
jgi:hypothetical protein